MAIEEHSQRIAVLEAKLDQLSHTLVEMDCKLDAITIKQMEIDLSAKVAYNTGKWVLYIATTILGWMNWDQIVAWVQEVSHPKH